MTDIKRDHRIIAEELLMGDARMVGKVMFLQDGVSLEFTPEEIDRVRQTALSNFGSWAVDDHGPSATVRIAGEPFAAVNEWGDACLISTSEDGKHLLLRLVRALNHGATVCALKAFGGPLALKLTAMTERRGDRLWLRFVVEGDVDGIVWPAPANPARRDGLWEHTCFEAFVLTDDGYREFNLSPSGQWASYRFDGYREGMVQAAETVTIDGLDGASDLVALEGWIDLPAGAARLGLSAVIEMKDGSKSYWALAHPSDKPDFHHRDSFVLDLPPEHP